MSDPLVVVTGADGFIGAAYCRRLAERGQPVRRIMHAPDISGTPMASCGGSASTMSRIS